MSYSGLEINTTCTLASAVQFLYICSGVVAQHTQPNKYRVFLSVCFRTFWNSYTNGKRAMEKRDCRCLWWLNIWSCMSSSFPPNILHSVTQAARGESWSRLSRLKISRCHPPIVRRSTVHSFWFQHALFVTRTSCTIGTADVHIELQVRACKARNYIWLV